MKTSRQRLLAYLEKKQIASAHDISLALKMTSANARHHLSILMDQGSVELVGKRPGPGRGRPHKLYRVVKFDKKSNITRLISALFQELYSSDSDQSQDAILRNVAERIIGIDVHETLTQTQTLNEAISQLNHLNYESRWEAHKAAPRIIFNNCPYLNIVGDIPEICLVDKLILENLLNNRVTQTAKLEQSPRGIPRCIFILE